MRDERLTHIFRKGKCGSNDFALIYKIPPKSGMSDLHTFSEKENVVQINFDFDS
jgi:hypothetical protein